MPKTAGNSSPRWTGRYLLFGNAYAVWTGNGAVGTVLLGVVLFGAPAAPPRLAFMAMIIVGIIGLGLVADWQRR